METLDFKEIQNRIVGVEREHADHLTTFVWELKHITSSTTPSDAATYMLVYLKVSKTCLWLSSYMVYEIILFYYLPALYLLCTWDVGL